MECDGNVELFPIAYGLVDQESTSNWLGLIFESSQALRVQRQPGCMYHFISGVHRFCMFYLLINFVKNYSKLELKDLIW